ncbi:MAG: Uma2 family endonuclease [Kouleothrix sp.]|nr:Uma2 family endonuclease [Kouleothrix sp.]
MATLTEATTFPHWTVDLVQMMPRVEGERYEIIDGELYVTTQPHFRHQATGDNIIVELGIWSRRTGLGRTFQAPGVVFAEDNAVAPDIVWLSKERMPQVLGPDGKLHDAPDLVIEILSPGKANEERDRDKKLALYSRQGVPEYWIVDWRAETVEIYRRQEAQLQLDQTLKSGDQITSPLLPGFACAVDRFFEL